MLKFMMLCGLPGSGKSTFADYYSNQYNISVYSSDLIRKELFGDINDQNNNDITFKTLHKRIKNDLMNNKNCIYDACNISYKRRISFLNEIKKYECEKICLLFATPYEECLKRNAQRERNVPKEVIKKMYLNFNIPAIYEGWDKIEIIYANNAENSKGYPNDWIKSVSNFDQNNIHHDLTLGNHCMKAVNYILDNKLYSDELTYAAMLHDEGKIFTKDFHNIKGESTDDAHYYNHHCVGAYNSLFYNIPCNKLDVANLIQWHMDPYFWQNDKIIEKRRKLWGEKLYQDILKIHEADKFAH